MYYIADYFSSVFTHEDSSNIPSYSMSGDPYPSISPIQIHVEGVARVEPNMLKILPIIP